MRALPWHTPARWRATAGLLALGGALAVALLAAQHEADPAPPGGQPGQHTTPALSPSAPMAAAALQGLRSLAAPGATPQGPARTASAVEAALYGQGSLRESTPDGGWQVDSAGQLRPDLAVRRRFDHLLSALGEATPEELGTLLQRQANRDLPPAAVTQVMALWQRYLALQQTRYTHQADLHQPASWQPALDERVRMRREWLGPAWADAFYLAEETALRSHIAARDGRAAMASTSAAPGDANPPTARLPDAARRPAPGDDLAALHQQRIT
ncbi:hypothetical protein, partial [Ideonella sp.]|uniref:hypothetical protein n=1 Tax=Ideonella sp. TaxID=1929293 RepID=UPI003BB80D73